MGREVIMMDLDTGLVTDCHRIRELQDKLEALQALPEKWRRSFQKRGVRYTGVYECADELEFELRRE